MKDIKTSGKSIVLFSVLTLGFLIPLSGTSRAEAISNPIALFKGLDKITGELYSFHVFINETVQFGSLQITPRVCYNRPPTEPARTTTFAEIDEITLDHKIKRVFTGWMFAGSPGLNALDHPVYDVWLTACSMSEPDKSGG